jgi:hypothetical protein
VASFVTAKYQLANLASAHNRTHQDSAAHPNFLPALVIVAAAQTEWPPCYMSISVSFGVASYSGGYRRNPWVRSGRGDVCDEIEEARSRHLKPLDHQKQIDFMAARE